MYKVLIVDDEHIERSYLKYILEKNNTEFTTVGEASNGRFAIDLFIDQKPDIVIMDISMPIINGIDAAIEIKRINPSTIIILNTAYAEFEFAQKAINHNMNAYILKPSSEAEILTTLRTCITTASTSNSLYTTYSNTSTLNSTDIIKHYIEKEFDKDLSLDILANIAYFSPSYLSHVFHQEQQVTIRTYVNQVRIQHALHLLKNSDISINEISQQCGFGTVSHFNRIFKKTIQCTPLEYRKERI